VVNFKLYNISTILLPSDLAWSLGQVFNTFINLGYDPFTITQSSNSYYSPPGAPENFVKANTGLSWFYAYGNTYKIAIAWVTLYFICCFILLVGGIIAIAFESITVAPDVLGYASNVARQSRYLHLPPTTTDMKGSERARTIGETTVMLQDVKAKAAIGKIALGNKHPDAQKLTPNRVYR
jgi:hypothetical protein